MPIVGTFCFDRVRKINGYEQPREARLSKHECPKFITPISPCPALPYSPPQERVRERKKGGKEGKVIKKKKLVRWANQRNKGIKRWLHKMLSVLTSVGTLRAFRGLEKLSFTFTKGPDFCFHFTDTQGTFSSHWSSNAGLTRTIGTHLELGSDKGDLSLLGLAHNCGDLFLLSKPKKKKESSQLSLCIF